VTISRKGRKGTKIDWGGQGGIEEKLKGFTKTSTKIHEKKKEKS